MADRPRPPPAGRLGPWAEPGAALLVALLAGAGALATFGVTRGVLGAAALLGLLLALAAWRRGRLPRGGGGAGVVQLVERRLAYWGPFEGGVLDLDDVERLLLDPGPPAAWILVAPGGRLVVPVDAEGAGALPDAFAALPGLSLDRLARALADLSPPAAGTALAAGAAAAPPRRLPLPLWERPSRRLASR